MGKDYFSEFSNEEEIIENSMGESFENGFVPDDEDYSYLNDEYEIDPEAIEWDDNPNIEMVTETESNNETQTELPPPTLFGPRIVTEIQGVGIRSTSEYQKEDVDETTMAMFEAMKRSADEELTRMQEQLKVGQATQTIIEGITFIKETIEKDVNETVQYGELPKVRTYNGNAKRDAVVYATPTVQKDSNKGIFIFWVLVGIVGGFVFGFMANSYNNFNPGQGIIYDFFHGMLSEYLDAAEVPFTLFPLDLGIVFGSMIMVLMVCILIGFFMWTSVEEMKRSRVGHEHGAAHLANAADYNKYAQQFIE